MKGKYRIIKFVKIVAVVGLFFMSTSLIKAAEQTEVPVSIDYSDKLFIVEIEVKSGGCIRDGSQVIQEGIVQFEQEIGSDKIIEVVANQGYHVKQIMYELQESGYQEDITTKLVDDKVVIKTMPEKVSVSVSFEKNVVKPELPVNKEVEKIVKDQNKIGTGDRTNLSLYFILIGASSLFIILIYVKKKRNKD